MDLILIAVGAGLAFWGMQQKDDTGLRTPGGTTLLYVGGTILAIGFVVFGIAFMNGFSEGYRAAQG